MSFRVRIYDAATEEWLHDCDSDQLRDTLRTLPLKRLMLRAEEGRFLGWVKPDPAAEYIAQLEGKAQAMYDDYIAELAHLEHQRQVRYGYRSVRPVDDDRSSV